MDVRKDIKDEERALILLASLTKFYKPLVQSILVGKSIHQLDEVVKSLKESQQMMGLINLPKKTR